MKKIITLLIILKTLSGVGQPISSTSLKPIGLYHNNNCILEAPYCGAWYFLPDSTFYYFNFTKEKKLSKIGRGKLINQDKDIFYFKYDQNFTSNPKWSLNYQSNNNANYDSVNFVIDIQKTDKSLFNEKNPLLVFLDDKFLGYCNSEGKLNISIKKKQCENSYLEIGKGIEMGIPQIKLLLIPSMTQHIVKAIVPGLDISSPKFLGTILPWEDTSHLNGSLKICSKTYKKNALCLIPKPEDKYLCISLLEDISKSTKYLEKPINEILNAMK